MKTESNGLALGSLMSYGSLTAGRGDAENMQQSPTAFVQRVARVLLVVGFAGFAPAQTAQPVPSRQEIDELISKADQKIEALSAALTSARHEIESTTPDLWKNQMNTISTAREMIKIMREKGPSAYRLVALNTTIDDISRASLLSVIVALSSAEGPLDRETQARLAAVTSAELASFDISELLGHATIRLIGAEEDLIDRLPAK